MDGMRGAGDGTARRGPTGLALAALLTAGALCLAACDGSSASKPAAASRYCSVRRKRGGKRHYVTVEKASAAGGMLRAEYPDERQRVRAIRSLGWVACHMDEGGRLEWSAIPAWIPAAQLLTARRLAAWAILSASAGLAIAATVWAAIPFGIVGWTAALQAILVSAGDRSTPLVLRPGGLRVIVPRRLQRREVVKLAASAFPLVLTAIPFLVRLWAAPAAGDSPATALSTYRADRMTSAIMAAAWAPFGALLVALPLIPVYGSADGVVAMVLFALGTSAFAGLMTGRYPLLKVTELMLAAQWRGRAGFLRLFEDAANRQVLRRTGDAYEFADDQTRISLAVLGRAALAQHAPRHDRRAGIGAALADVTDGTVTRASLDIGIGLTLAYAVLIAVTAESVHDPVWLTVLVPALIGGAIILFSLRYVAEMGRGIVGSARWRQANLTGVSAISGLRGLIVAGVAAGTAWLLYAQDGPALVRVVAAVLPAAFAAGSGAWACVLLFARVGDSSSRWRRVPDALLAATIAATILLVAKHSLVTVQPFAGLLFPPAVWAAFRAWRAMNGSHRLAVKAGADIVLSLLLGAQAVLLLVWLANVLGLPTAEIVVVRDAAEHAGSLASLPWWVWTGIYVLLAGWAVAFLRWPGRLANAIRWFRRLRVVPTVDAARRTLTVVHISLLVAVLVGLAAPTALATTFQRQMKSAYVVALQRKLEAEGELAVYAEIRSQFTAAAAQPVLTSIVLKIHDISPPGDASDADATPTETDLAHRVGELQALALGAAPSRALIAAEQAAASEEGFDGPVRDASDVGGRLATVENEQTEANAAAKRADEAGDLAASAVASTISIPHISDNEVFQIVREYLSGLIEDSPLKDTFAAWAGRLAGAKMPPDADQAVIPDPRRLEQAALTVLSAEVVIVDPSVNDPAFAQAETESPIDAAVDLANQSRYSQEGSGPCAGCVRSPADPDNPVEPPDDHDVEP